MSTARTTSVPPALFLAALVTALLAVVAVGFGVLEAASTDPRRWIVGVGTGVLMLAYGAFLLLVAHGLRRARRWSRGPAVAVHLLHLPVAWSFLGGSTTWVTLALGGASLLCLVCLLLPVSTVALTGGGGLNGPEGQH
ncbi:hypothetical protein GC722_08545 [Auraticoccus sp. F435]|uniref:Integral membrane protein n=1 Tax=Auraticoccus cholistanensis TaxID=2656650 RepID=A0A6A9V0W6_9ACTN|nr:hypothetical protein [Auraticoccus cholistanensis]MVA76070.1 hypothetical protein [Auraticoccus cholistanensis]